MIGYTAQQEGAEVIECPVRIEIQFYLPRPKSHYGTGKNKGALKESAPWYHIATPDIDKLVRCVLDALTGVAWKDDSQVVSVTATKSYGIMPGARIKVSLAVNHGTE